MIQVSMSYVCIQAELSRLCAIQPFWIIVLKKLLADNAVGGFARSAVISKQRLKF